jgi:hypothetical protein
MCLNSSRELENTVIHDEVKPIEDHIKWDERKKGRLFTVGFG